MTAARVFGKAEQFALINCSLIAKYMQPPSPG